MLVPRCRPVQIGSMTMGTALLWELDIGLHLVQSSANTLRAHHARLTCQAHHKSMCLMFSELEASMPPVLAAQLHRPTRPALQFRLRVPHSNSRVLESELPQRAHIFLPPFLTHLFHSMRCMVFADVPPHMLPSRLALQNMLIGFKYVRERLALAHTHPHSPPTPT